MKVNVTRSVLPVFCGWMFLLSAFLVERAGLGATHQGGAVNEIARSLHSEVQASLTFRNRSAGIIKIYWLDFTGRPVLYFSLDPGGQVEQTTYVSHPWLAVDAEGAPLAVFYPSAGTRTVDVFQSGEEGDAEPGGGD